MLDKTQIENNIDWLQENSSYPVKCLTYKNLLNDSSAITSDLIGEIEKSDIVKDIFSKQEKDGSWCSHGEWAMKAVMRKSGYTPVSPKYVTTSWILPILGDLGYSVSDERIKKAFDLLSNWQRDDGGWVSENHLNQNKWTRSCPFSSYHSTMALYSSGINSYEKQIEKALGFLLNHLSTKTDSEIQRFFYHGHSIIHELLMFSELKIGLDSKVIKSLLSWLLSMYQPNSSYFKYNGKPTTRYNFKDDCMDSRVAKYRLFQLIEDDWLTYYATRIFKNILENTDI